MSTQSIGGATTVDDLMNEKLMENQDLFGDDGNSPNRAQQQFATLKMLSKNMSMPNLITGQGKMS